MIDKLIKNKTIIRFLIYRRMFTPYEIEQCYSDEDEYVDDLYTFGVIEEYQEIPNDILLKIRKYDVDTLDKTYEQSGISEYYRLSEIRIAEFDYDKNLIEVDYD